MRCQAAAGAYDKPAALLELIPMIFGPVQQTAQWETGIVSRPTRLLFAPQSSLVSSDVCSVGVMKDEEGILSHVSSTSPSPRQTHWRRKYLSLCMALFRLFRLFDGCLPDCLWIRGTLLGHSSCSHHFWPALTNKRRSSDK